MRILHTESSCGWGGQEIRILDEAQGMSSRGHEVGIAAPRESRIYEAALERGLRAEALPIARKDLSGLLAMRRRLKAHEVDVVNSHSSTDSWLAALACATLARAPALVRTRHVSAAVPDNLPTRWLYHRATLHVVTTGEALRLQLLRDNRLSPERVTSVPTGIDTERFVPGDREAARRVTGLPSGRRLVGIVATLRSWKGHRYLIEAVNGLPPGVGLVIVGDGPQRRNIETTVRELGMSERVWLAGNQRDVLPWLQSFDVFALPSYANEGVPQALLQAMLCGLPCVTTTAGSIGEIARDGATAIVVAAEDAADLRRGLDLALGDTELAARLGSAARAHCAANFGAQTMLDRMERVFKDAARL
ncbi:MAG TPA: glycosyltransferase family 4 protein [Burkholderiales bacterium]|nr:glycosyltransferase family 4 protein [Burkholderiales bacterium]